MVLKNLNIIYNNNKLFENFELEIFPHQITVILGASGCGKSTLLRVFSGLIKNEKSITYSLNKTITKGSFVFQEPRLLSWRTAFENIILPLEFGNSSLVHSIDKIWQKELIDVLGLGSLLKNYPHQLSGGQQMRVALARALITKPQTLYLDEPFAALDESARHKLQETLIELKKALNMTVVFVTHSFSEAAFLADRVLILSPSRPTYLYFDQLKKFSFTTRTEEGCYRQTELITEMFYRANQVKNNSQNRVLE